MRRLAGDAEPSRHVGEGVAAVERAADLLMLEDVELVAECGQGAQRVDGVRRRERTLELEEDALGQGLHRSSAVVAHREASVHSPRSS
jgi:hypothetical protein